MDKNDQKFEDQQQAKSIEYMKLKYMNEKQLVTQQTVSTADFIQDKISTNIVEKPTGTTSMGNNINEIIESQTNEENNLIKLKLIRENILKSRMKFIDTIAENPLYVNENFTEPWKVVSR